MKAVVVLGDGMADRPVPELGGRTPLMAADAPGMHRIAREGRTGLFQTIESDLPTGSEIANLVVLGYDPRTCYQGRGVLEAAGLGVPVQDGDLVMRVNLITVEDEKIKSHSSGHITSQEAARLLADLQGAFPMDGIRIVPGLSYRHVLVLPGGDARLECAPPHDHVGHDVRLLPVKASVPPAEPTAVRLNRLVSETRPFLRNHPVNRKREADGKLPGNSLWPWSPGTRPDMAPFREKYGRTGAVISAVDLIKGLAVLAGMDVVPVRGATGLYDTNYEGKAEACLQSLETHDFVYVHVEAPDEAGHERNTRLKIRCIEDLDRRLIRRILDGLGSRLDQTVLAVLPDHATPVSSGNHGRDPVPVAVRDPGVPPDAATRFDEESVRQGNLGLLRGSAFIRAVLRLD